MVAFLEQHGLDTRPAVLIVRDGWGGKAIYEVQHRHRESSQRPHTEDIAGPDLRYEAVEHGPEDDMPQYQHPGRVIDWLRREFRAGKDIAHGFRAVS
jgi:hypothetical protein